MPTPLKDLYSAGFVLEFTGVAVRVLPDFHAAKFTQAVFTPDWKSLELKARMYRLAESLRGFLAADFPEMADQLVELTGALRQAGIEGKSLEYMFLPAVLEQGGTEHPEAAARAMDHITGFASCEFAVRPLLLEHPRLMLRHFLRWADHPDLHVRRLASEGCRPRLPWAMAIPFLKADPAPILPVLEKLKDDPAEYVRRSVANNLNDIAKDHPQLTWRIAQAWKGTNERVDWVVRHGCRTLLKKGIPDVLQLFGFGNPSAVQVDDLRLASNPVRIGDTLRFAFQLKNTATESLRLRVEYEVFFRKANGSLRGKVFHLSERTVAAGAIETVEKDHSFRVITTRAYYPGKHEIAVRVNGVEKARMSFQLAE